MFLFVIIVANGESGYNYKDVVAQAYCSSKSTGYIMSAVRRDCDPAAGPAPSCDFICGAESEFRDGVDAYFPEVNLATHCCDGALWLMMDHPILAPNPGPGQTGAGLLNMVTISYDKCDATDCGPNYCCCIACGSE